MSPVQSLATVVYVTFRTTTLELDWIPSSAPILVVENDDMLDHSTIRHPEVRYLGSGNNIGFGAGANQAIAEVTTERVILVNPDTQLQPEHWRALAQAEEDELVVLPLRDSDGRMTSVVNRYPTPISLLMTSLRAGRFAPRGSAMRRLLLRALGRWGREHQRSLERQAGRMAWPLSTYWPSAAVCSYPTALLRAVGGFDEGYFLYVEDTDLARRLSRYAPQARIRRPDVAAAVHTVSASSTGSAGQRQADLAQSRSCLRYAEALSGWRWRAVEPVLRAVVLWRARHSPDRAQVSSAGGAA